MKIYLSQVHESSIDDAIELEVGPEDSVLEKILANASTAWCKQRYSRAEVFYGDMLLLPKHTFCSIFQA